MSHNGSKTRILLSNDLLIILLTPALTKPKFSLFDVHLPKEVAQGSNVISDLSLLGLEVKAFNSDLFKNIMKQRDKCKELKQSPYFVIFILKNVSGAIILF